MAARGTKEQPRLVLSDALGKPPFILESDDLEAYACLPGNYKIKITKDMIVKSSTCVQLSEAEAMDFVSKNTKVNVPKLIGAYTLDGVTCIMMERVEGEDFADFWERADDADKQQVLANLKDGIDSMRSVSADYVGCFGRMPFRYAEFDGDARDCNHVYGPYADDAAFHEGLIDAWERSFPSFNGPVEETHYYQSYKFKQLIRSLAGLRTVLTHGDLNSSNILVRKDLSVVILDWDTAGFMPEYWEWWKAAWRIMDPPSLIRAYEQVIPPFWMQACIMQKVFDDVID